MNVKLDIADVGFIIRDPVLSGSSHTAELLQLAAIASDNGGNNPGDSALCYVATEHAPGMPFAQKENSWSAPEKDRPYSLATVRKLDWPEEFLVARGDPDALMDLAGLSDQEKASLNHQFEKYKHHGFRGVGVAVKNAQGEWTFKGMIPMIATPVIKSIREARTQFRYFHVWDWQLRIVHWMWVVSVLVLAATGLCIEEGWFLKRGDLATHFQFGDIRFIHFCFGWVLIGVLIMRFACFFMASNKYQTFGSLFPIKKQQWKDLFITGKDYLFVNSEESPRYMGHNPLQQWTYTGIYGLFTLMVVTGLALYALYEPTNWFYSWFMPLNDWIGIANVRLVHTLGMWTFLVFAIAHVYLGFLSGNMDRDGTISSMVSGGRWARKGVKFNDE